MMKKKQRRQAEVHNRLKRRRPPIALDLKKLNVKENSTLLDAKNWPHRRK